jgi:hypothetical protein
VNVIVSVMHSRSVMDLGCEKFAAVSLPANSAATTKSRIVPLTAMPIACGLLPAARARRSPCTRRE